MVLKKDLTLYERDEKGELIPKEVEVEVDENDEEQVKLKGETIFVTPMSRGEIKRLFSDVTQNKDEEDLDGKLILKHCKNPKYEEKDIPFIKPALANVIVNTIFREKERGRRRLI